MLWCVGLRESGRRREELTRQESSGKGHVLTPVARWRWPVGPAVAFDARVEAEVVMRLEALGQVDY